MSFELSFWSLILGVIVCAVIYQTPELVGLSIILISMVATTFASVKLRKDKIEAKVEILSPNRDLLILFGVNAIVLYCVIRFIFTGA